MTQGIFGELDWRGLVHQITSEELPALLERERLVFYVGFDPTATSLHAGSLVPLLGLQRFRQAGHSPIVLLGGATGLIGDPSGKSTERQLESEEVVRARSEAMRRQIEAFLAPFEGPAPIYVDNIEWLGAVRLLDFLRDVGKHFSVNQMMQRDSVKKRFETEGSGISFTEFSYSLLQSMDFLELHRRYGCRLQFGASDQWGNIVAGIDLVRRMTSQSVYGLTFPLLTTADGRKYGKSEKGAVWLDPAQTSPFAFYQFWVNAPDQDVGRMLRWFTFLPREEIEALEQAVGSGERTAQKALAMEVTRLVHGAEEAERARAASEALFAGDIAHLPASMLRDIAADVPGATFSREEVAAGVPLPDLLVRLGAAASKSEARRLVRQGAIRLDGVPVPADEEERRITAADIREGGVLVVQRGRRHSHLLLVDDQAGGERSARTD